VVVGYGGYDESGAVDEEDEDLSDFMFSDSDEGDSDDDSDDEDWEMLDEVSRQTQACLFTLELEFVFKSSRSSAPALLVATHFQSKGAVDSAFCFLKDL
jgi:hypothetical protein